MENSVYLCVKQNINCNNFNCYKFNNFIEADKYFIENFNNNSLSTMIPVYKYLPLFIQKIIIDYKLKNLFVKSKIITNIDLKK
jgi:hypothetical protein